MQPRTATSTPARRPDRPARQGSGRGLRTLIEVSAAMASGSTRRVAAIEEPLDASVADAHVVVDLTELAAGHPPPNVHEVPVATRRCSDGPADGVGVPGAHLVSGLLEDLPGLLRIVSSGRPSQQPARHAPPLDVGCHQRHERTRVTAHQRVVGGLDLYEHASHLPRRMASPVKRRQHAAGRRRGRRLTVRRSTSRRSRIPHRCASSCEST
jgi:hypothetical protein